jgi:hypothetical protein
MVIIGVDISYVSGVDVAGAMKIGHWEGLGHASKMEVGKKGSGP